jgi:hypothetical protein
MQFRNLSELVDLRVRLVYDVTADVTFLANTVAGEAKTYEKLGVRGATAADTAQENVT